MSEAERHASSLVRFTYEEQEAALGFADTAPVFAPEQLMIPLPVDYVRGDLAAGLAEAAVVIDQAYETAATHHNALEAGATVAQLKGGRLTVHTTTQDLAGARLCIATSLSLPLDHVRVVSRFLGGGFGGKNGTWPHAVLASLAAGELGRPVRLELTRQQMFSQHGHRGRHRQRIRLAAGRDGRLTAMSQDIVVQTDGDRRRVEHTGEATPIIDAAPHVAITHRGIASDIPAPTIMRAPGAAPGMFALESAMDELAFELGIDPVELRLRNDAEQDAETGLSWSSRSLVQALTVGAERFGWAHRPSATRSMHDGRWLVGQGVAGATYPALRMPCSARVRPTANGEATVETAATDIGTRTYTILTRIAAETLRLPADAVHLVSGDSDLPPTPGSGGSWGAMSYGTAVLEACHDLMHKIAMDGPGDPGALVEALRRRDQREAVGEATAMPPEKPSSSSHGFGAHFVEVRIDPDTSEIRVARMLGVFGVGRLLNPKTARSRLMGGMVRGLGMALTEASILDEHLGHFVNADLAEYRLPVNADVRELDVVVLEETEAAVSPLRGKGLGEIGIVGVAAAIANAVHHATGVRVRELPIKLASLAGRI